MKLFAAGFSCRIFIFHPVHCLKKSDDTSLMMHWSFTFQRTDWLQQFSVNFWNKFPDVFSELIQISEMECFAKRKTLNTPMISAKINYQKIIKKLLIFHKFQVLVISVEFYHFSLIKVLEKKQETTSTEFFKLLKEWKNRGCFLLPSSFPVFQ